MVRLDFFPLSTCANTQKIYMKTLLLSVKQVHSRDICQHSRDTSPVSLVILAACPVVQRWLVVFGGFLFESDLLHMHTVPMQYTNFASGRTISVNSSCSVHKLAKQYQLMSSNR